MSMIEKNPGSTEDFMESRTMQAHFAELSMRFLKEHPYIGPSKSLGRPASAATVELVNSQEPTTDSITRMYDHDTTGS